MGWEIALMLGYFGISTLLIVIAFNLNEKNFEFDYLLFPLKILLVGLSMFIILLAINSLLGILTENGLGASNLFSSIELFYRIYLWGIIVPVSFYFIVYIIFDLVSHFRLK